MLRLDIDARNNRITAGGVPLRRRTRWLAVFLQTLVERGRRSPDGVTLEELERALAAFGRPLQPLLAKQVQRLVDGLRAGFAEAGQAAAFDRRFRCDPLCKTVGPWAWVAAPGDESRSLGAAPTLAVGVAAAAARLPALAESPLGEASAALAAELKQVLALRWDGKPDLAIESLQASASWARAAPETAALRHLKLGEMLASRRDFDAAVAAFGEAEGLLDGAPPAARGVLLPLLRAQRGLAFYAQQPAAHYQEILDQELAWRTGWPALGEVVNPVAEAKRLNLLSLCERRWIEAHRADATPAQWDDHVEALLRYGHAALFMCLACEQFERARNVSANLAYAHQQLARWIRADASAELPMHLRRAMEWYALSMSIHWRFDLPDNLTFQYVFLGELWLSSPAAREAFEAARLQIAWDGERPDDASFYETACTSALELGDPRQIAYAALNKLRFGEITRSRTVRNRALKLLDQVFDAHPDLYRALRDEGYAVPARPRQAG